MLHFVPIIQVASAFGGAAAVFVGYRVRKSRVRRCTPGAIARLPHEDAVDWQIAPPRGDDARLPFEGVAWATIDAGIATLPLLEAAHEVNPVVVESLSRWVNHGHLMDAPSLFEYVRDHHEAIFAAHSDLGFVHALEGYVGEAFAAHDLTAAGHHVFMPDATNVPGWDLDVDGHLMQVKVGQDALEHAHRALLENPQFHIITDPVTAHALDHAVGLQDLAPDHLEAITTHTLHGADALAHAGSVHFPIVTAILSTTREIDLLSSGSTDVESALKNAGLDVAGTGGGLAAGAKAGALAGMWLGPHGAAIGAIVGGIAGAIGGRTFTNGVKRAPLDKAVADFEAGRSKATAHIEQLQLTTQGRVRETVQRSDVQLKAYYKEEQRRFAVAMRAQEENVAEGLAELMVQFEEMLNSLRRNLSAGLNRFTEAQGFSHLRLVLWPREEDLAVVRARQWVKNADRRIAEALECVKSLKEDSSLHGRTECLRYMARFTASNPFDARPFAKAVQARAVEIREHNVSAAEQRNTLVARLTEYSIKAKHGVDVRLTEMFISLTRDIQSTMAECKTLHENMKREAGKLGIAM